MLEQFQQALADLVASPGFVSEVCEDPEILRGRYQLSEREWRRLVFVVNQPGMMCNCMLYRANRLTPIAEYLPALCKSLAGDLNRLLTEYWAKYTDTNLNFLVECYRFCQFVREQINSGAFSGDTVAPVLEQETAGLTEQLKTMFCTDHNGPYPQGISDISTLFAAAGIEADLNAF